MPHSAIPTFVLLAGLTLALPSAYADDPAPQRPTYLGVFGGIYQGEGLGGGDGLGARAALWALTARARPVHFSARLSYAKALNDSSSGGGYEAHVAYALVRGQMLRLGERPASYWALVRDAEGKLERVVEANPPTSAPIPHGWWEIATIVGVRGFEFAARDTPRGKARSLTTTQVGLAAYIAKGEGMFIATAAIAHDFGREVSGVTLTSLMRSGTFGLELSFAGYWGYGNQFAFAAGAWF